MSKQLDFSTTSPGTVVYWLLDLYWAGQTIRLSTHELDVYDEASGEWLHYTSALDELRLNQSTGELASQSEHQTIPIEAVLPVDVPALIAQGHDLAAGRATLSRWIQGTDYKRRRPLIHGRVADPYWGSAEEAVAFSIEENVWQDRAIIPGATQRVDGTTWPQEILDLQTSNLGVPYVMVYGHPGQVAPSIDADGWVTATEARWVMHSPVDHGSGVQQWSGMVLVIAAHHVSAERVYINTASDTAGDRVPVYNGYDALGNPIAYIPWYATRSDTTEPYDFDSGATYDWVVTDFDGQLTHGIGHETIADPYLDVDQPQVYVGWLDDEDSSRGGAQINGRTVREGGDLLEWLLSYTTIPVDHGRFAAARPLLSRFKFDGCVRERSSPWEYLKYNVLPMLPVSLRTGPSGSYPVVWRFDVTRADAIAHIDADSDPRVERISRIKVDSSNLRNDFELRYAYSRRSDRFMASVRLGAYAQAQTNESAQIIPSPICRRSQERFRLPDGNLFVASKTFDTRIIYDTATAHAITAWWAAHLALPWRTVAYVVPEDQFPHLEPGSVVQLTDSTIRLSGQVALVQEVQMDNSGVLALILRIMEDPARDLFR